MSAATAEQLGRAATAPAITGTEAPQSVPLRPTVGGTVALVAGIAVSFGFLGAEVPSEIAGRVARVLLVAIGISVLLDMRVSLRNLVRVDLFAILALYFLTFFEFLFDQRDFNRFAFPETTGYAVALVLMGFLGLALGRHLMKPEKASLAFLQTLDLRPGTYVFLIVAAFCVSTFYMFLAVGFNVFDWFHHVTGPRFTQPWGRGRFGGWKELLNELALLGLVIPPMAGVVFARRKEYAAAALVLVAFVLLLQFFISIAPGTRNSFAVNLAGLLGGYFLSQPKIRIRSILVWGGVAALVFVIISDHMLGFRNMGLRNYVEGGHYRAEARELAMDFDDSGGFMAGKGYFVDYNLLTIHDLTQVFPDQFGFLGWNLYWVAFTKPIPRALWPGKPTDLAVGIEEALGVSGMTLAATFVGEAYIAGGAPAVFLTALILGVLFAYWNRLGCSSSSIFALLVYSAGFFAALITMRSLMMTTTLFLPAIALIAYARFLLANRTSTGS